MTSLSLTLPQVAQPPRRGARPTRSRMRALIRVATRGAAGSARVVLQDVVHGLLEVSHNMLALLGLLLAITVIFAIDQGELRHGAEAWTLGWLQARQVARAEPVPVAAPPVEAAPVDEEKALAAELKEPDAIARATASDLKQLNRQQASVAQWLARRYHVAPEPVSRLVQEAWSVGQKAGLDPTLILAIMAVESSFNPFAQSAVGAQGLMQVMTKVHNEKYQAFGGNHAAFDPVTNLRVGAQVLKECIARAGSIDGGLRSYVGAGAQGEDGGYAGKVLFEQASLKMVANGKAVSPQRAVPKAEAQVTAAKETPLPARPEPAASSAEENAALSS